MVDLDELLKIADAPSNAHTRSGLDLIIQWARGQTESSIESTQTPAALLKQVDKSITKTVRLLRKQKGILSGGRFGADSTYPVTV
jgi:DNA polymerase III delta prime subunit